jgi:hypothetical protein
LLRGLRDSLKPIQAIAVIDYMTAIARMVYCLFRVARKAPLSGSRSDKKCNEPAANLAAGSCSRAVDATGEV